MYNASTEIYMYGIVISINIKKALDLFANIFIIMFLVLLLSMYVWNVNNMDSMYIYVCVCAIVYVYKYVFENRENTMKVGFGCRHFLATQNKYVRYLHLHFELSFIL